MKINLSIFNCIPEIEIVEMMKYHKFDNVCGHVQL